MAESLHILLGTSACLQWLCHSGEQTVAHGPLVLFYFFRDSDDLGVVGWCEGVVYLMSPGRPTDIGLQLGKACYPCSRLG